MMTLTTAKKSINPAFFRQPVPQNEIERLNKALSVYLSSGKQDESEEFHKNLIKKFLEETFYSPDYAVNTNGREDLVIFGGNTANSKPAVIIEAKSPSNTAEMFSETNFNCKALQECVYYFLQENLKFQNNEIKHIIITNYYDFYIFDAKDFARFFLVKTNPIVEQFKKFEAGQLSDTKTAYFYENCAKPAINKWIENENIVVTKVTPAEFYRHSERSEESLIPLYKIFSPEHLLGKPFANDSNSLDKNFYEELLHIVGLEEVKESGKKVIRRKKEADRDGASLLESAIYQLEEENLDENGRYEVALRLAINWINRLIFLKLVESQQLAYRKGDEKYRFLTTELVPDFDSLNILFFKVLGRRPEARDSEVREKFRFVPYLNSSLFEPSVEEKLLQIRGIMNKSMKLFPRTVLKDKKGRRMTGKMDNLAYIFRFLDSYNFSSETESGITQDTKTLINASVLGLIFEKINGYKDGSFFTPGFITEYMAKETVERTVIQKFNNFKGWKCETLEELADKIDDRAEANEIINSIRIYDPAVGSGHFLVSVLNRLLFIKSYLDILFDKNGRRIRRSDWALELENDEISILDDEGNPFVYSINPERQRVQEAIFNEKRTIIENCLFGVDINPASVYICRLRLWIELLKNAYYTEESGFTQLETLPNIDINIKCGNSLVSRYSIKTGGSILSEGNPDTRKLIRQYREAVAAYKNENNKENKRKVDNLIQSIKRQIHGIVQLVFFDEELNKKILDDDIYADSLEWMIEFPEVLADTGKFLGFDAVIGNPPYISANNIKNSSLKDFFKLRYKTARKMFDLYSLFTELSSWLLKPNGSFSFIFSNSWLGIQSFLPFRKFLAEDVSVTHLVKLPDKVFDNATVKTIICSYQNKKPNIDDEIEIRNCDKDEVFSSKCKLSYKKILSTHGYNFTFEQNIDLSKVQTVKLGSIMKASCGIKSANDKKFILNEKRDEDCYPIIRGRNLRRWEQPVNTANEYIWYKPELMKENINCLFSIFRRRLWSKICQ
ncbi:Eco57I restriction-modification methylase domain-containing protein [bacterium]|nr:Eco57I restriction-modification methylase domain-containing protein [bacterium]